METSRHAVRRSTISSNKLSEITGDLPCYGAEELADFQDSVPMPSRLQGLSRGDRESTEEIQAVNDEQQARATQAADAPTGLRRQRVAEPTQPIPPIAMTRMKPGELPLRIQNDGSGKTPELRHEGLRDIDRQPWSARTSATAGDVLAARYVVIDKLDHCGMGLVYKALDRHREKAGSPVPWVALKFAQPAAGNAAGMSTYLRQEFLKLSQLNHPNIVSVFDLACDGGLDFIVMEWLEGETLATLLSQITSKRIALDKAKDIVRSVARGLARAHDLGIVHGDVKPSNIFLADNRTVKVLDFGSSGKTVSPDSGDEIERNWATRAYASCEVLEGQPAQPRDDVFALGVTAYYLLSGERPFGDVDALTAREHGLSPGPLPSDSHDSWPAVARALNFDAIDRSGNAKIFLQEFDELAIEPAAQPAPAKSPAVAYGALAATLLASLVWVSVQSVGGLPPDVQTALVNGNNALADGRLLEPEKESAFAYYSTVLAAAPDNANALQGLNRIAEEYLTRARVATGSNDVNAALANLEIAKRVSPEHFGIAVIEDLIGRQGKDFLVGARQAAETDMDRAEQLLAQAESLLPADDPELARVRAGLSQQKIANEVDMLLQGVDDRILAERLTVPEGDSAVDLLRKARRLAPTDREVSLAADRIMTALLFQSMFATSNGDLDDAERYILAAKAMGVKHLALARAEYELAKAHRRALSSPGISN